jgi:hypothetical protein
VLIECIGSRGACFGLGAISFTIAYPAVAPWIRERPSYAGERLFKAPTTARPGLTVRQAGGTGRFWVLAVVFFLAGAAVNGTIAHIGRF